MTSISKIDAAAQQLNTAIDLYFEGTNDLSVYTLAYASFKVLFDIYPHRQKDGFAAQLDKLLAAEGWKRMSRTANFLKHADRDPDAFLEADHPDEGYSLIGLATLLYRRLAGDFTPKMRAFDHWVEVFAHDELGIEEVDENLRRADEHRQIREALRIMEPRQRRNFARKQYLFFLENFERIQALVDEEITAGLTVTEMLDKYLSPNNGSSA